MKQALFLVAAALLSAGLIACGDDGDAADSIVHLETDPGGGDSYTIGDRLIAKEAGTVLINYDNRQPEAHDVAIEDSSGNLVGKTPVVKEGRATVTLDLDSDETYTYYCTVANHRERGQEGTLTFR
jgi:hypothetical protein